MYPHPTTGELVNGISRVRYTADAMIDVLISQPGISQNELASIYGYSPAWVSVIINSDAFQARLAERKSELIDPVIIKTIDERVRAVAQMSLDKVLEKLELPANMISDDFLINSAKLATTALGYGARPGQAGPGSHNVQVVVNVPGVAPSAEAWAAKHATEGAAVIEAQRPVPASLIVDHENPRIALTP